MKSGSVSPSVAIILGKGKPQAEGDAPEEESGDEGLTAIGKALCEALEKKDYAAIGAALKDSHEYCQPDPSGEDE